MSRTKKSPTRIAKPLSQFVLKTHFITQAKLKHFTQQDYQLVTHADPTTITRVRRHNDRCVECNHFKFEFFAQSAPAGQNDPKIIGCIKCEVLITIYPHERTHGNTVIHSYQTIESYLGVACGKCGHQPLITRAMTATDIAEIVKHDCD